MTPLRKSAAWIFGLAVLVLGSWISGILNEFLWSPKRTLLFVENLRDLHSLPVKSKIRFVLCWIEDDPDGREAKSLTRAFSGIEGVEIYQSATSIPVTGAGEDWHKFAKEKSHGILDKWNADVAIFGAVSISREALSLWMVPIKGQGTLRRGDSPYPLRYGALHDDFHEDVKLQIRRVAARAINANAPSWRNDERANELVNSVVSPIVNSTREILERHEDDIVDSHREELRTLLCGNYFWLHVLDSTRPYSEGLDKYDCSLAGTETIRNYGTSVGITHPPWSGYSSLLR